MHFLIAGVCNKAHFELGMLVEHSCPGIGMDVSLRSVVGLQIAVHRFPSSRCATHTVAAACGRPADAGKACLLCVIISPLIDCSGNALAGEFYCSCSDVNGIVIVCELCTCSPQVPKPAPSHVEQPCMGLHGNSKIACAYCVHHAATCARVTHRPSSNLVCIATLALSIGVYRSSERIMDI